MMTNPHNHLYCEQYAEVGTRLDFRHRASGRETPTCAYVIENTCSWKEMFVYTCCLFKIPVVTAQVSLQHIFLAVFNASSPGEVHSGGFGKPGTGQKIFCPGAEAEQPKHEGIVWSVHGEYCFT